MPFSKGIALMVIVAILLLIGQFITEVFIWHPVACLLLVSWLLLVGQYMAIRGGNMLIIVILFIAILVLPMLGLESLELVDVFVTALFFSVAMAVLFCWLAHGIVHDPGLQAAAKTDLPIPSREESFRQAMIKTLLVLPLLMAFFLFQWTSDLLVLIFVALLIQMPSAEMGIKGAIGTLSANTLGGLTAVVCYQLLVIVPSPVMLAMLVFAVSLMFGQKIYSDSPVASLYGTGLNTVIVLLGATTATFGDAATVKMWVRLLQIGAACIYIVLALSLAANWLNRERTKEDGSETIPV